MIYKTLHRKLKIEQLNPIFVIKVLYESELINILLEIGLWCLTPLSTIFQLYRGGQFYWRRQPKYLEKTIDCSKSLTNFMSI
jgi:hypothetical protein